MKKVIKKYDCTCEEVFNIDKPHYEQLHKFYEERGRAIPNGAEIWLSNWGLENLRPCKPGSEFLKVRNAKRPGLIIVLKKGNQQPTTYWAGFWLEK